LTQVKKRKFIKDIMDLYFVLVIVLMERFMRLVVRMVSLPVTCVDRRKRDLDISLEQWLMIRDDTIMADESWKELWTMADWRVASRAAEWVKDAVEDKTK